MISIHKKAIWGALLVGILSVLPYVIAYVQVPHESPQKLHYYYQDSELVYLARIREILEGRPQVSTPYFLEYKHAQNMQQPFGEFPYALLTFGNPDLLPWVGIFSKFLFPGLLFYIVYLLGSRICSQIFSLPQRVYESVALFIATFVVLGLEFNHLGYWRQVFTDIEPILQLSLWTRLVNPITGGIGLFLLAHLLFRIDERQSPHHIIGAGLLFGLMSGYIFSFSYAGVMVGGMFLFAVLQKRWMYAKALFSILTIGIIINAPYITGILFGETDIAALKKSGLLLTHAVLHNKILYTALGVLFIYTFVLKYVGSSFRSILENRFWQWSSVMIIGGIFLFNQQVLTGQTVWPGHYVQYTNPVVYLIVVILGFAGVYTYLNQKQKQFLPQYEKMVCVCSWIGIGIIFLVTAYTILPAFKNQPIYTDSQRYAPALEFFRMNAEDPCVVFVFEAVERLEKYVPAYTYCDLYHSAYTFHAIPPERVLHNYIVYLRMVGVPKEEIDIYLTLHEADIHRFFFEDWVDIFPYNGDTWLFSTKSKEAQEAFLVKYKKLIGDAYRQNFDTTFDLLLKKYHIDYILYDTNYEVPGGVVDQYPETFRMSNLVIREVK